MSRIRSIGTRTLTGLALGTAVVALASPAFATISITSNPQTYATQAVTAANGALTISANVSYTSAVPTTASGSFLITFTLPTGVTFASTPSAAGTGGCAATTLPVSAGGNGTNSVTFTATVTTLAACAVNLNAFLVSGATALEQPTTTLNGLNSAGFNISEQVTGSNVAGIINETSATPIALAFSGSELVFYSEAGSSASTAIDVTSPSLGTKFLVGSSDQVLADIGRLYYGTDGNLNATASGAYNFPGSTLSITLTGNFSGIGSAYLDTGNNPNTPTCATDASTEAGGAGVIAGTVAANSVTFSGVNGGGANNPFLSTHNSTSVYQEVCLYATGTQLLGANPNGFGATASISPITAQMDSSSPSLLQHINYNGVVQQLLYATAGTNYPGYVRIVNNSGNTIKVFASVQADGGSVGTTTVESGLAPNSNDLVPVSTIASNAGVTLGPYARTSLTLFAPGASVCVPGIGIFGTCPVSFSLLEVNPSGDVVQLGSGSAP